MIDTNKCKYEESFHDTEIGTVYYFSYPKDLCETNFSPEEEYGNVVCMCISLTEYDSGNFDVMMSPTVEEDDEFIDVEWKTLIPNVNYTNETIKLLLDKIKS